MLNPGEFSLCAVNIWVCKEKCRRFYFFFVFWTAEYSFFFFFCGVIKKLTHFRSCFDSVHKVQCSHCVKLKTIIRTLSLFLNTLRCICTVYASMLIFKKKMCFHFQPQSAPAWSKQRPPHHHLWRAGRHLQAERHGRQQHGRARHGGQPAAVKDRRRGATQQHPGHRSVSHTVWLEGGSGKAVISKK